MFILPPPPKYPSYYGAAGLGPRGADLQPGLEATNGLTHMDDVEHAFTAPEGTYKGKDCVFIATPLPHPSDPIPLIINPLAPTNTQPSTYSSGIRLSITAFRMKHPPGYLQNLSQIGLKKSESSILLATTPSTRPSTSATSSKSPFGINSSWTSSIFSASGPRRASAANISEDQTRSGPSSAVAPATPAEPDPFADPVDAQASTDATTAPSSLSTSLPASTVLPGRKKSAVSMTGGLPLLKTASAMPSLGNNGIETSSLIPGSPLPIPVEAKDSKRRKPKNSLIKNNSSFVSRTVVHEHLTKRLAEHPKDDYFAWVNVGRSLSWLDLSPSTSSNVHEPLSKILFTKSHPLCHDINQYTRCPGGIDLVIGTSSGDALWIEPTTNKYNRINKNGDVTRAAVIDVKWIPGSENLFVTVHADGLMCIFDKEREDAGFIAQNPPDVQDPRSTSTLKILRSLHGTSALPGASAAAAKQNPVAVYKMSNRPLTSIAFSPNGHTLAVGSNDGYLRIFDLKTEQFTDIFPSYYGGFLSASFSPDGKYLAAGGQDDLLTIYSMDRRAIVARGQGHSSWVRRLQFDPWVSDSTIYRIGSVGEDGKLVLWDFNPKLLNRPKLVPGASHHSHRRNVSGSFSSVKPQSTHEKSDLDLTQLPFGGDAIIHPFKPQSEVPMIHPIVIKPVKTLDGEPEPLSDLLFLDKQVIVAGKDGRVWIWDRPQKTW